jgi:hypothetical protein
MTVETTYYQKTLAMEAADGDEEIESLALKYIWWDM